MIGLSLRIHMLFVLLTALAILALPVSQDQVQAAEGQGKVKVLYHVDGKDPDVAKYALALINKHIDAEGGPDKIDVELVVHGPALELFEKDRMDPEMTKRFDQIIEKGVKGGDVPGVHESVRQNDRQSGEGICCHFASGGSETHR